MDAVIDVSLTYYFLPRFCINYSSPRNMHLLQKQKGSVVWLSVCECVGGCGCQHARACVITCHQRTLAVAPLVLSAFCLTQGLLLVRISAGRAG